MIDLAVNGYSRDDVIKRLHSNRTTKFKYNLLNRHDVGIGELTVRPGGTITLNSLAQIKRTANFVIKEVNDIDWLNDRIQPVFCVKINNDWLEWPLGVFLMSSPSLRIDNRARYRDVEAYDPSLILVEDKFDNRYIISAGTSYGNAIQTILNEAGIWKVNITPHLGVISTDKEFEIGSTKLSAINTLLSEINYTSLWVDENGYFTAKPYIIPSDREAEYTYSNDKLSIIFPGAVEEEDLFSVPNKWVLTASNPEKESLRSVYVNDLPTSRTSTISRGRTIVDFRIIDDVFDQQTLDDKVMRLAYETSQIYGKFIFETAIMPHHSFMDILYVEHTDYGISAKYTETSWTMTLSHSGRMQHNARRVIMI